MNNWFGNRLGIDTIPADKAPSNRNRFAAAAAEDAAPRSAQISTTPGRSGSYPA